MKTTRILCLLSAIGAAAWAADPAGTWQWTVHSPTGEIATTLKLEAKDGKFTGAYSNQYGETAISAAQFQDDVLSFDVVRDFGGSSFVLKYRGKLEGDAIKGTIETPDFGGGDAIKLDWNAQRTPATKPKS